MGNDRFVNSTPFSNEPLEMDTWIGWMIIIGDLDEWLEYGPEVITGNKW